MDCRKCGSTLPDGAVTCIHCSTQIGGPSRVALEELRKTEEDLEGIQEILHRELAGVYAVESVLGQGGMAFVFKATELELHRLVALKVLRPELLVTRSATERFRQEARIAARLDHPGIIPIYRVGQAGGVFFIAMRFVEGRSLHAIVESQGALPLPVVLNVLRASLSAMAHAHEHGIVHRDIKGGNILVDVDGRVTVADFGIARPVEDTGMTATGAIVGTPAFMSPEQWSGGRLTAQSDQYAIGVLAFQLLTGSEPFEADSLPSVMQHHLFTPIPDLRAAREGVPPALIQAVNRALAKKPKERFSTTREMLETIEAIPYSDADHRESTEILQQLAQGAETFKVRTRSLPPLPEITVVIEGLRRHTTWRSLLRPWPLLATAFAALLAGLIWFWPGVGTDSGGGDSTATRRVAAARPRPPVSKGAVTRPDAQAPVRNAPLAPQVTESVGSGRIRLSTIPPIAEIRIDGQGVGVGTLYDYALPAGNRRLTVVAPGYQNFDTTVAVRADEISILPRIRLKPREGGP